MRLAVYYPSLEKDGRRPLWGQNRQFKFAHSFQVRIFPLVPASAATWWQQEGHEVLFLDGPNTGMSREEARERLRRFSPDLIAMDTKAPILSRLKDEMARMREVLEAKWAVFGDMATAWPEKVFRALAPDFLLVGGDVDWTLMRLARHLDRGASLPGGVWRRVGQDLSSTGAPEWISNLDDVPLIDRELTGWRHYGEAYLHAPSAYILSGRGCGGRHGETGQCAFCVWQHTLWQGSARLRSPGSVADEIEKLHRGLGAQEVFDDNESGPTWQAGWLEEFIRELEKRTLVGRVRLSANARADHLTSETCGLLKRAGFRLLKVGLESGNEETLRRLRKGETVEEIISGIRTAKDHGLRVLMTVMVGYPWEGEAEAQKTLDTARSLLHYKARFGDCLQASVLVPYPGTPLYEDAARQGLFLVPPEDLDRFDMDEPVLRCPVDPQSWCRRIWRLHMDPGFLLKSLLSFNWREDRDLAFRGITSLLGHVRDYAP